MVGLLGVAAGPGAARGARGGGTAPSSASLTPTAGTPACPSWTALRLGEAENPGPFADGDLRIASLNVTSLQCNMGTLRHFDDTDVLCLQEVRLLDQQMNGFRGILRAMGWEAVFGAGPPR